MPFIFLRESSDRFIDFIHVHLIRIFHLNGEALKLTQKKKRESALYQIGKILHETGGERQ